MHPATSWSLNHSRFRPILLLVIYFLLSAWATVLFGDNPPVRVANAVALVFLLRSRLRLWPVLLAATLIAAIGARVYSETRAPLLVGALNTLEVTAAALLIRGFHDMPKPWYQAALVPRLLAAWLVVPAASAFGGAMIASGVEDRSAFFQAWQIWYGASALGLLIVTALLLTWTEGDKSLAFRRATWPRLLGFAAGVLVVVALVVQQWLMPLLLLTFPCILLLTWRYGLWGASGALVGVAVIGGWATLAGFGSISNMVGSTNLWVRVQALQLYLAALVLSSLPFAILFARQRMLTSELRRVGQARSEFLSAMSHEIRTPLTGVLGMVDLLGHEALSPKQARYVESIRSSGRHLLAVINDILDFSRIETGRLQMEAIDFSLPQLLEDVRSLAHPTAVERGLALEFLVEPHSPPVLRGDPTRLKQILLNLIGNAVKFTPHGSVTLAVSSEPQAHSLTVHFAVRDTGIGISPEKVQELFQPFTQADRSIARQFGGSGLGLAISRRLAHAMGGDIAVSSAPGQGSTFTLTVPMELGDMRRLTSSPSAASSYVPSRALRILVAEDVPVNREIIGTALERHGHQVVFAEDGLEAVDAVRREAFDLVFMDIQMPRMDGVMATREIRKIERDTPLPIVALTANVMSSEQERYLEAGMDACVMKPIDWPELFAVLERYAAGVEPALLAVEEARPADDRGTAPEAPLIDEMALESLRAIMPPDKLKGLLLQAIEGALSALAELDPSQPSSEHMGRVAHKIKGSCGTMGFKRLSMLAAVAEAEANVDGGAGMPRPERLQQLLAVAKASAEEARNRL